MKCPNCNSEVKESDLMASLLTDCLLCCPHCKGKSKHFVVGGLDPTLVYNEAQSRGVPQMNDQEIEEAVEEVKRGCIYNRSHEFFKAAELLKNVAEELLSVKSEGGLPKREDFGKLCSCDNGGDVHLKNNLFWCMQCDKQSGEKTWNSCLDQMALLQVKGKLGIKK